MRFRAAIDGCSRGNPGPAAWGVAVLDEEGRCAAMRAIGTLGAFRIQHVRRERNKEADRRVNVALNQVEAEPDNPGVRIREDCGSSD